jgi:RNA polymerase sigma-B factor
MRDTTAGTEDGPAPAEVLLHEYARTRDARIREAIVLHFQCLAYSAANRYRGPIDEQEDVCQVALLGLIKAVDRFDPSTSYRFSSFALPTIEGEIRRHFRDGCWKLRVPRGLQKLAARAEHAADDLHWRLGRPPTPAQVAEQVGVTEEEVREALGLAAVRRPVSIHAARVAHDGEPVLLEEILGTDDQALKTVESRVGITQALARLHRSHRRIIELRYLRRLSQREVARRLGLSQVGVSRLERQALHALRVELADL